MAGGDPLGLGCVRLNVVACLPACRTRRGEATRPAGLPALARLVHGWFTTVAPG
jgi:hypothetical protein